MYTPQDIATNQAILNANRIVRWGSRRRDHKHTAEGDAIAHLILGHLTHYPCLIRVRRRYIECADYVGACVWRLSEFAPLATTGAMQIAAVTWMMGVSKLRLTILIFSCTQRCTNDIAA
jgi:hypothetical protein